LKSGFGIEIRDKKTVLRGAKTKDKIKNIW
jgi:hypothetical protein